MIKKKIKKNSFENVLAIVAISVAISSTLIAYFYLNRECEAKVLKYWSVTLQDFSDYALSLRSHHRVFKQMNIKFVNASNGDDWDIMWALETPFSDQGDHKFFQPLKNKKLLPHQKVNHFPGITVLVSKSFMNDVNRQFDFILPSFVLPEKQKEFDEYIAKNPGKKILEKNFYNRGVQIINVKNLKPKDEHFYQEFMDNPFLIDGFAFDFGVYVLITSVDPIRVYRYKDDIFLRFCSEKYHPFNPKISEKYVVKDGSRHITEMPSFAEHYKNFKFSSKIMFENLISKQGFDVKKFWSRIDRAIVQIAVNSEKTIVKNLKNQTLSSHHFFEFVRFDIILDAELNPYVVEVNMSPNLTPAQKSHEENSLIYEQLIFNVMKMIGASSHHEFFSRLDSTDSIVTNHKNLATSFSKCLKNNCQNNCNEAFCEHCQPCLSSEVRYQLSEALREHQNSANFKRVFPSSNHFNEEKLISKMTKNNQIQMSWLKGKCEDDDSWC